MTQNEKIMPTPAFGSVPKTIRFEDMPRFLGYALDLLQNISSRQEVMAERQRNMESKLNSIQHIPLDWIDIEDVRNIFPNKPAKQTVYQWMNRGEIPYYKSFGKSAMFLRSDIDDMIKNGRVNPKYMKK